MRRRTAIVISLYAILERFETVADRGRALPALFAVMERCPAADLGSPGSLVHSIETLPVPEFAPALRTSLRIQPGLLNVRMVNRILNAVETSEARDGLMGLPRAARDHPRAGGRDVELPGR